MSKFSYKNISEEKQVLMGFGEVEAGGVIKTDEEIENPNFELVKPAGKVSDSTPTAPKKEEEKLNG